MKITRLLPLFCFLLILFSLVFINTGLLGHISAFSTGAKVPARLSDIVLRISPTTLPNPTVGVAYNQLITASGGQSPYNFSLGAGSLPTGLSITSSGLLLGTPTIAGTFIFTLAVSDAVNNMGSLSYRVTVTGNGTQVLMFSPNNLPNPVLGVDYNQTITVRGGQTPYTFSITDGALPDGLSLSDTGMLTGTPTVADSFTFTITAIDPNNLMGSLSYSVIIMPQTLMLSPSILPSSAMGVVYSQTFTASGGQAPYTFSINSGSLPSGLSLSSTGVLMGTPTVAGSFTFAIIVRDANNNIGSISYTLIVDAQTLMLSPNLANPIVGVPYNQTVTASGGQDPYTFSVLSGQLPDGLDLSPEGVLSGTPTTAGTFVFTLTATDANNNKGSLTYILNVTPNGSMILTISPPTLPNGVVGINYSQILIASGGKAPYAFALTDGTLPPGLSLNASGNITGTPLSAGMYPITIGVTDTSNNTGALMGTITIAAGTGVTLTPATLPDAVVGIAYSQAITVSGGQSPYTLSIIAGSLPPGLTLAANGLLSGVPTMSGSFNFLLFAVAANKITGSINYTVNVARNNPLLIVTPPTLPNGIVGVNFNQPISATGDLAPYVFTIDGGTLPPGLTLNSNGQLSGVPLVAGNFTFTVTALSLRLSTGSQTYTINILNSFQAITLLPPQLPDGVLGADYSQAITAIGGQSPYSLMVTSGSLPPGLTLDTGTLAGIPTAVGTYPFTLSATDTIGKVGRLSYTIRIVDSNGLITLTPTSLPIGMLGTDYSQAITATGGQAPYRFAVTAGNLPKGLSLSVGGQLTGMPSMIDIATFTITATDASNRQGRQTYTLLINSGNIILAPETLPSSILGANYDQFITATGGQDPYVFTVMSGNLPSGLTLLSNGELMGIPVIAGSFSFTILAVDSNGDIGTLDYTINSGMVSLLPATLDNGTVGVLYDQPLTATGGEAPYTFTLAAGTLPPNLSLDATGELMGIPTTPGQFSFALVATDANGFSGSQFYMLTIDKALSVELDTIYVADTGNNRIQRSKDGINWTNVGLGLGSGPGQFRKPEAVTASADGQTIYVADKGNNRIQKSLNGGSTWVDLAGSNLVKKPQGVALALTGDVYVADTGNSRILRFANGDAAKMTIIATKGSGSGQVLSPQGLAIDINNNLYIADKGNSRILKIVNPDTNPTFAIVADSGSALSPLGQVRAPQGVSVDNMGNLYVADTQNRRVIVFPLGDAGAAVSLTAMISGIVPAQVSAVEGVTISHLQAGPLAGKSAIIISDSMNNRIIGLADNTFVIIGIAGKDLGQFSAPSKIR